MIKIPSTTPEQILEILRKRQMEVKYSTLKRYYIISYNDIKKIERIFMGCVIIEDIKRVLADVKKKNEEVKVINHQENYLKYKDYYNRYNRERCARIKAEVAVPIQVIVVSS